MSDHRTWHAVSSELVNRGYRVLAPDLRGHGKSPRGEYTPENFGADLIDTLPAGADVAIGHSLGGLSLALAAEALRPQRAVYVDPGFAAPTAVPGMAEMMIAMADSATAESVRQMCPRWSTADIEAELAGFALFDRAIGHGLADAFATQDLVPPRAVVSSLVLLADPSLTIDESTAGRLAANGFEIRVVRGTGHCIHRDDLGAFFIALDGWI